MATEKNNVSPAYHNTWKLLRCYRDVVWSLELTTQELKSEFEIGLGDNVDDLLDTLYAAGLDFGGTDIEGRARSMERSRKMLAILNTCLDTMRAKYKFGENYYWILYYAYLSPQQLDNVEDILEALEAHMKHISYRTYFREKKKAIHTLSTLLWGYTTPDLLEIVDQFLPEG